MPSLSRRQLLAASGAATLGLAGCASRQPGAANPSTSEASSATSTSSAPARVRHAKPLQLTQSKRQADRTLASVTRLDKHPLWFMTWYGDGATIAEHHTTASNANYVPGFACTLWVATGTHGKPIVGRNWDWEHGPGLAMVSETKAARTLTLTDTTFLGLHDGQALEHRSKQTQEALLHAEAQLVEGINEHGVFIGLAADAEGAPTTSVDRPVVGGLGVQRLVLDQSRTVEDAVKIFRSVDVDFTGGPALHYLVADRHGGAAAIEFNDGKLYVEHRPAHQPWFCLENFHMATVKGRARKQQARWSTCAKTLGAADGVMSEKAAFTLLDNVRQGITQWSTVYDLAAGTASVHTSVGKHSLAV